MVTGQKLKIGSLALALGRLQFGDVTAFIRYSQQFTQPIIQTANIANILQSTIASAERVFELLDEQEEIPERPTRPSSPSPTARSPSRTSRSATRKTRRSSRI